MFAPLPASAPAADLTIFLAEDSMTDDALATLTTPPSQAGPDTTSPAGLDTGITLMTTASSITVADVSDADGNANDKEEPTLAPATLQPDALAVNEDTFENSPSYPRKSFSRTPLARVNGCLPAGPAGTVPLAGPPPNPRLEHAKHVCKRWVI